MSHTDKADAQFWGNLTQSPTNKKLSCRKETTWS